MSHAATTLDLSVDAVAFVDAETHWCAGRLTTGELNRLLDVARVRFMPELASGSPAGPGASTKRVPHRRSTGSWAIIVRGSGCRGRASGIQRCLATLNSTTESSTASSP